MQNLSISIIARKSENDILFLYLRVVINRVRKDSALHRSVEKSRWNANAQKMKGNTVEVKEFNEFLQATCTVVYRHYKMIVVDGIEITPMHLLNRMSDIGRKETMLLKVFKNHNDRMQSLVPFSVENEFIFVSLTSL